MGNLGLAFGMLLDLSQRCDRGEDINKDELHAAIESCKRLYDSDVDNNNMLTTEQKEKRKRLFSKMVDAAEDYIEQRLRDENRLNE